MAAATTDSNNCQESNNPQANNNANAPAATVTCGKGGKTGNPLEALWSE